MVVLFFFPIHSFFQLQKMYAKDEEIINNTDDPLTDQITSRWDISRTHTNTNNKKIYFNLTHKQLNTTYFWIFSNEISESEITTNLSNTNYK